MTYLVELEAKSHISNNGKVKTMIYFCLKLLFCVLKLFLEADGQESSGLKFKNAGSTFSNCIFMTGSNKIDQTNHGLYFK